jgi:hypothetical protein
MNGRYNRLTTYKETCGTLSIEQKRKDLLINPLIDHSKINKASDKEINLVHEMFFTAMNASMENILGESMFDDDW